MSLGDRREIRKRCPSKWKKGFKERVIMPSYIAGE